MAKNILVPLDGSPLAEEVLGFALQEALQCSGQLTLLRVVPVPTHLMPAGIVGYIAPGVPINIPSGVFGGHSIIEEIRQEDDQARAYLEKVAGPLRLAGATVDIVTLEGSPGQAIIDYAVDNRMDLIAIATCGHSGLHRMVFGSVFEFVLKNSPLPVLVINPQGNGHPA